MRKFVLGTVLSVVFITSAAAMEHKSNTFLINGALGIGTFSAGEYDGGSVFLGGSISADWIPNGKTGLSYGIESGLLGGKKEIGGDIILGIPIIFRFGWHPDLIKRETVDLFALAKTGWGLGLWGSGLDEGSVPDGIVCGISLGGSYLLTSRVSAYAEVGYNYYGLARNSNYPEYPLGYGSGKTYTSAGVSLKLF